MNDTQQKRYVQSAILFILLFSGVASIWYWGPPSSKFFTAQELNQKDVVLPEYSDEQALRASTQNHLIQRYVTAYQTRNCAEVAKCTLWVQDRIRAINGESKDTDVRETMRFELCGQLFSREDGADRISILGIDDRYLIPVTARFAIEGADSGRSDLGAPVLERVWCMFTYSDPVTAPKDEDGAPIQSLRAGVNVSTQNLILKGSVRGNWEIDFNSISMQW